MNELESEVAHLVEENARLKKQQQQVLLSFFISVTFKIQFIKKMDITDS